MQDDGKIFRIQFIKIDIIWLKPVHIQLSNPINKLWGFENNILSFSTNI